MHEIPQSPGRINPQPKNGIRLSSEEFVQDCHFAAFGGLFHRGTDRNRLLILIFLTVRGFLGNAMFMSWGISPVRTFICDCYLLM